jgi:hypothetical protein
MFDRGWRNFIALLVVRAPGRARVAAEGADHRRTGHWQYRSGTVLAGVSAGLRDLGYVEGQNIRFEFRSAGGQV